MLRHLWAGSTSSGRSALSRVTKRLFAETWLAHRDYPQEDFYGIGPDSARQNAINYGIRSDLAGI
jgi:hypothetical protein